MITKGPVVEKYAMINGLSSDDVLEWMNKYIRTPDPLQPVFDTEQERESSIKQYVAGEVK